MIAFEEKRPYRVKHTTTFNSLTREISNAIAVKWNKGESYSSLVVDESGVKYFENETLAKEFADELNKSIGFEPPSLPCDFFVPCSKKDKNKLLKILEELEIDPDPDFENIWYGHNDGFYVSNYEYNVSSLDEHEESIDIISVNELKKMLKPQVSE